MSATGCVGLNIDYAQDARGRACDVVDLARTALAGLQAGDVVHPASVGTSRASVDIVRAGEVIGTVVYVSDRHGGWLTISAELCDGLGFHP